MTINLHKCPTCSFSTLYKNSLSRHISVKHSGEEQGELQCEHCDYKTSESRFMKQHVVTKHVQFEIESKSKNLHVLSKNLHEQHSCDKCKKCFSRVYWLHNHTCRGVDMLTCTNCLQVFDTLPKRWRHERDFNGTCEREIITSDHDHENIRETSITPVPSVQNINYNNHGTINNITNNNQIIINFPEKLSDTPVFITTDDQKRKLIDLVKRKSIESPEEIVNAIMMHFQDMSSLPFRKESLHLPYTHVHNEGRWELTPDEFVYPKVVLQTSQDMVNILQDAGTKDGVRERPRLVEKLDKQSDKIGDFFDHVEDIERHGTEYGRIPLRDQQHRKAFRSAKKQLKLKAKDAYLLYGCPT